MSETQKIDSPTLAEALKGAGDALPLMEDMVRLLKEGKPVPQGWLAERVTRWRHDIEVVMKAAESSDKTKRELTHLVLQMAAQIEKLAGEDVCAQALCVAARGYVRSSGLEPAPVRLREDIDVRSEHAKDAEIVALKASIGAIHFMCLHYPGGADLSVIASECEFTLPVLTQLRPSMTDAPARRPMLPTGFSEEQITAMADACGISISRRDDGPYPTMEQLARFAALATGADLQPQRAEVAA